METWKRLAVELNKANAEEGKRVVKGRRGDSILDIVNTAMQVYMEDKPDDR